jgi:hypothetical protein
MAVVGNVGTYAQVDKVQGPDFGKMTEDAFDKIAQRKALEDKKKKDEAAAKAKAVEDLGPFGVYEGGLPPALDEKMNILLEGYRTDYNYYKSIGDISNAEKSKEIVPIINSSVKVVKSKIEKLEKDLASPNGGVYDKDFVSKTLEELSAFDKDSFLLEKEGANPYITIIDTEVDEQGNRKILVPKQTIASWIAKIDPPLAFDDQKDLSTFLKNNPVSRIESKKGNMFTTVDDVMDDKTVIDNIESHVRSLSNSDSAMANWLKSSKNEYKARDFSKQEKEEFIKDNIETYKNAYREVVSLDLQERSGGSGSGKKDDVEVTPPVSLGVTQVDGIPSTFNKDTTKYVAIEKKAGSGIDINGNPLTGLIWDEDNGKLFYGISLPVKGSYSADSTSMGASEKTTKYFSSVESKAEMTNVRAKMSKKFGVQLNNDEDLVNLLFKGIKPPKRDKNGVIIK